MPWNVLVFLFAAFVAVTAFADLALWNYPTLFMTNTSNPQKKRDCSSEKGNLEKGKEMDYDKL